MITIAEEIGQSNVLSSQDLKTLAGATPPCISFSAPFQQKSRTHRRIQKAVNEVEARLDQSGVPPDRIRSLLEPLESLAATIEQQEGSTRGAGLVVLRSPELMTYFWVRDVLKEWTVIASHLYIRPLLPSIAARKPFYILSLSQKNIRLFRCNGEECKQTDLQGIPASLQDVIQTDRPDHVLDNRIPSGPSTGSMKGVMFGTGTDREHKDGYLLHFYKQVDLALSAMLKERRTPVVLAGVDYEVGLYRNVSAYPDLIDEAIGGTPDNMPDQELHRRAMEVLERRSSPALDKALALFRKQGGPQRPFASPREIVKAAAEGRVAFLFLIEGADYRGNFAELAGRREQRSYGQEEDLMNATALETVRHGGEVFLVPADQLSEVSAMGAVLRY